MFGIMIGVFRMRTLIILFKRNRSYIELLKLSSGIVIMRKLRTLKLSRKK